jgi:hypothetical protein
MPLDLRYICGKNPLEWKPNSVTWASDGILAGPATGFVRRWTVRDAAIAATGQSLYAIAQASGVAAPVLQRFVNGERGITLETARKLAAYLGLALMPGRSKCPDP